jgi:monothiol glutaredoxin
MIDNPIFKKIKTEIDQNDVVLFMKGTAKLPMCGFSGFIVQVFQSLEIQFKDIDVLQDPELRQGIKDFTSWPTIPQLYIKGEFVGGADIVREMYQKGELKALLQQKLK